MAKKPTKRTGLAVPTTIHEAMIATNGSGAIYKGVRIDEAAAIANRQAGKEIVVYGSVLATNRAQAREIERQASPAFVYHNAHPSAGPDALPHFQPASRPPQGHTFFEGSTRRFKAKKIP